MATIFFCDTAGINENEIGEYLRCLPGFMRNEINRCAFTADRKNRLAGRLMLLHVLRETGNGSLIHKWALGKYHKPFIEGWKSFNISHSGERAVFSYGTNLMGIDIEKKEEADFLQLISWFHPAEQEFIMRAQHTRDAFYEIWVKKEAFLKAVGIGIADQLHRFNCINDKLSYKGHEWHFHPLPVHPSYTCYLCTPDNAEKLVLLPFIAKKTSSAMLLCHPYGLPTAAGYYPGNF
jgi:4'-phosphopantetheinyl transferase